VANLIAENKITTNDIKFFLGYSGWDSNQLETELKSNAWVVTKNTYKKDIIEKSYETFWKEKMVELGGDYSIWSNAPENPSYN
jgi:putative transcriptional regulator